MTFLRDSDFQLITTHEPKMVTCRRYLTLEECSAEFADLPTMDKLSLFEYQAKLDIPDIELTGYTNYFSKCVTRFRALRQFCTQEFGNPYDRNIEDFRWYGDMENHDLTIYLKTRADALHLKLTWGGK